MSSLRGEEALKDGLSFEFTWTARHLLEVMEERAEWIRLGGLPNEHGVDFRLGFPTHEEHHQVKRAFGNKGEWKLAALDSEGVLADFNQRLGDSNAHCHFVSTLPAVQLGYLANKARSTSDFETFQTTYLTSDYRPWFEDLVRRWGMSGQNCWERLKRVKTRHPDESEIESSSLSMLRAMVVGDPREAWVQLRDFCFAHLHQKIRSFELWQWLGTKGVQRQPIQGDPRVLDRLQTQTKRYLKGVRDKLIQPPLVRSVASTIVQELAGSEFGRDIIVLGAPGGGKSAVMLQITDACVTKGWPVLAFRLDELSASLSPTGLQESLDLPVAPARAISLAAAGKPAVVIIDQLDAVSHYSGRTSVLFDRVAELVQELRGHRLRSPIHLVIACRDVDWRHDGRFGRLHRPHGDQSNKEEGIHKVEGLSDEEIKTILTSCGFDAAAFSPRQRDQLLRRPQYLAILIETHPSPEDLPRIVTPKQLFDAYWEKKERALSVEFSSSSSNLWPEILRRITMKLSETALALAPGPAVGADEEDAPLAAPKRLVESFPRVVIDWMITNGVLAEGGNRIRFAHESFFDYCFARFFEERGETLLQYLLRSDQTLIQRGQLRQVMAYLRDENLASYLEAAQSLLDSDQVRPHLKQLLVVVLCEVPDPAESEWKLLLPYIERALADFDAGTQTTLACQVFYAFSGSLPLFRFATQSGTFARWLIEESAPSVINRLFWVLQKHQKVAQNEVWQQIKPLVGDPRYESALDGLSHFCVASDCRETFEWLLDEMRSGVEKDEAREDRWDRFYSLVEDLANNQPVWLAEWIAAHIRAWAGGGEEFRCDLIQDHAVAPQAVEAVAARCPSEFVKQVLPAMVEVLELKEHHSWHTWSFDEDDEEVGMRHVSTDDSLFLGLIAALRTLVVRDPHAVCSQLDRLRKSSSDVCKRIHAAVLCGDSPEFFPLASEFLASGEDAFFVTYRGKPAACSMFASHADRFSHEQITQIEQAILNCYPEWERELRKSYPNDEIKSCLGTYRGHRQMVLLRAIPKKLLSKPAKLRLDEWERKFDSVGKLYRECREGSPINAAVLKTWNPARYLAAIVARRSRTPRAWRRAGLDGEGKISGVMSEAIKANPDVFIQYLEQCDHNTDNSFLEAVAHALSGLELNPQQALVAANALNRLGSEWGCDTVRLLDKVPSAEMPQVAFDMLVEYATTSTAPDITRIPTENGKRSGHLHSAAINSLRGRAIEAICHKLWDDPGLVIKLHHVLPSWMRDTNAAVRTVLAHVCYAVAFTKQHRPFAVELFNALATEELPDDHVLASRWPFQFMRVGLREHWSQFRPIIEGMIASESSEVRSAGARLACIGLVAGVDAIDLAKQCVTSVDPKIRAACADVLSHNLDAEFEKNWAMEAFLQLANDADKEVCRTTGRGFYQQHRRGRLDFGRLDELLKQYVKTRAFVIGSSSLIDAISDSRSVLPATVFEIIRSLIQRFHEPVEDGTDRLSFHIDAASAVLKRLYHENRDCVLRRQALDMIDELCLRGSLSTNNLDE